MSYRPGTGANRRKMSRLPASTDVTVTIISGLLRRGQKLHASGVDYNRYGMAFHSPLHLRPNMRLALDIRARHMVLRQVRAQVVSAQQVPGGYRIGVRFYRKLSEFNEPGPGHPLHFLMGLEQSLESAQQETKGRLAAPLSSSAAGAG